MNNKTISVIVVTFNSEKTIIESLESVYNQTYDNVELIIADDASKDNTVNVCRNWINERKDRFVDTKVITSEINTGVAINLNRGIKGSRGEWIKILAGDDLLPADSLSLNYDYVEKNNINTLCCSKTVSFYVNERGNKVFTNVKPDYYTEYVLSLNAEKQYKKQLYEYVVIPLITSLININLFESYGYFDEKFPEIEDHPFCLKITKAGVKINYNSDIVSYFHRTGINSVSQTKEGFMNVAAFDVNGKLHRQDKVYVLPFISKRHLIFYYHFYIDLFRRYFTIHILHNKRIIATKLFNKIFMALDPYALKRKVYNSVKKLSDKSNVNKKILGKLNSETVK